jgi:hypothetical protein
LVILAIVYIFSARKIEAPVVDTSTPTNSPIACSPESRGVQICTAIYAPVCAKVNIQCIKAPCLPIEETFASQCNACANPLVESYVQGECPVPAQN